MAEAHRRLIRKLREHSRLSSEDLAEINALSHTLRELAADEDLIRRGDDPDVSALVLSGMVARYHLLDDGRRQYLSFHMAGDMPDAQARGNLRQLLAATRRPAPFLGADAGSIGFSAGMVATDLADFEAAIAEDTPAALERAAGLYRADLLDGFSLRDRDFEEWLSGERERLREHAVQLFLRLMERAAATGVEPAIRWALRILAVDPVHEPAHRALMELYAAQGRHGAALRQYEQLRETLGGLQFDALINTAAQTNVDRCETHPEEAFALNGEAPRVLAEI